MTPNKQEKFSELFTNILIESGIEFASGDNGYSYVVYNDKGLLFYVLYHKITKQYRFSSTNLFKLEYKKYDLETTDVPDPQKVFESVAFAYKIRQIVQKAKKNVSVIYDETLIDSDVILQHRRDFETYVVMNSGFLGYAIGYNPSTKQYGFKRYELVKILYKICDIPLEKKPDYAKLYKKAKDQYMAQVAFDNIQHLYD